MFSTYGTIPERMKRMPVSEARKAFPDLVNQAFYAEEITVVTRRGKGDVAAIVPMKFVKTGNVLNAVKAPQKKPSESASAQPRTAPIKLFSLAPHVSRWEQSQAPTRRNPTANFFHHKRPVSAITDDPTHNKE